MFTRDDSHLCVLLAHGLGRGDGGVWRQRLGDRQDLPRRLVAQQVDWAQAHGLADRVALLAAYGFDEATPDQTRRPGASADPSRRSRQPAPRPGCALSDLGW
ncbi:MAG: hypothetical protein ACRYG2_04015 [Janthinobacterium lividum]